MSFRWPDHLSPPDPGVLLRILRYDLSSGKLYWLPRPSAFFATSNSCAAWNGRYSGAEAFTAMSRNGYLHGKIFRRLYLAHRIAWALTHGAWPEGEIDHVNGNRADNRVDNLREVSHQANSRNRASTGASKFLGVGFDTQTGKWRARISDPDGRQISIGRYDNEIDAARAYLRQSEEFYGCGCVSPRAAKMLADAMGSL